MEIHTTLKCLVLFRDLDNRRGVLHNRDLAGRAEVGLAGLISLPTSDATLMGEPTDAGLDYSQVNY